MIPKMRGGGGKAGPFQEDNKDDTGDGSEDHNGGHYLEKKVTQKKQPKKMTRKSVTMMPNMKERTIRGRVFRIDAKKYCFGFKKYHNGKTYLVRGGCQKNANKNMTLTNIKMM